MKLSRLLSIVKLGIDVLLSKHLKSRWSIVRCIVTLLLVSSYEATLPLTRMTKMFEFGASLFSDFSWREVQHYHQFPLFLECGWKHSLVDKYHVWWNSSYHHTWARSLWLLKCQFCYPRHSLWYAMFCC